MTDPQDGSIIKSKASGLSRAGGSSNPLINRMADDVLSRVKANQIGQERIQLGDYSFRPPDYRQIIRWAHGLGLNPLALISIFERTNREAPDYSDFNSAGFEVVDGSIRSIEWDFNFLPFLPAEWEHGLNISYMGFLGDSQGNISLSGGYLPRLEQVVCCGCNLVSLQLRNLSSLRLLDCSNNRLIKLDLRDAKQLEVLICSYNQITHSAHINLNRDCPLRKLDCSENKLNYIDLSFVPNLVTLCISGNEIAELDLSSVPQLSSLICEQNRLASLDACRAPGLLELRCGQNCIESIHIGSCTALECFRCEWNRLRELRLDTNLCLTEVQCYGNPLINVVTSAKQQSSLAWSKDIQYSLDASFAFYSGVDYLEDDNPSDCPDEEDDLQDQDDEMIAEYLASRYSSEQLMAALFYMCKAELRESENTFMPYTKYSEEQLIMALYISESEKNEGGDLRHN